MDCVPHDGGRAIRLELVQVLHPDEWPADLFVEEMLGRHDLHHLYRELVPAAQMARFEGDTLIVVEQSPRGRHLFAGGNPRLGMDRDIARQVETRCCGA